MGAGNTVGMAVHARQYNAILQQGAPELAAGLDAGGCDCCQVFAQACERLYVHGHMTNASVAWASSVACMAPHRLSGCQV